jgi:hypothetical protein
MKKDIKYFKLIEITKRQYLNEYSKQAEFSNLDFLDYSQESLKINEFDHSCVIATVNSYVYIGIGEKSKSIEVN